MLANNVNLAKEESKLRQRIIQRVSSKYKPSLKRLNIEGNNYPERILAELKGGKLPNGWIRRCDEKGRYIYYHVVTKQISFKHPNFCKWW